MFFDTRHHLLYDVEDYTRCPHDEQMSLSMAYRAYVQGCRYIMVTPPDSAFLNAESKGIPSRSALISCEAKSAGICPIWSWA